MHYDSNTECFLDTKQRSPLLATMSLCSAARNHRPIQSAGHKQTALPFGQDCPIDPRL